MQDKAHGNHFEYELDQKDEWKYKACFLDESVKFGVFILSINPSLLVFHGHEKRVQEYCKCDESIEPLPFNEPYNSDA